jgi:osmotically-inducible protein OsmY
MAVLFAVAKSNLRNLFGSTEMRSNDEIKNDVLSEIDFEPRIESTEIGVTVDQGAVTLFGTVQSYYEELAVIRAARRVKGVHAVIENIEVKYPSDTKVTDEDIAKRISQLCEWSAIFRKYDLKADVKNGRVTLTGTVDWQYQRSDARDKVAHLRGVKGVTNAIIIKPHASPTDVKQQISKALHRSATVEASKIDASVVDGKVTLNGHVNAWYERKLAAEAAWSVPGVRTVENNIKVA